MNIWYLHHYATPYEISGMHRPFAFGEYFYEHGHNTTVFSSSYLHFANMQMIQNKDKVLEKKYGNIDTVFVRTSPYKGSGKKRVWNMIQYGARVRKAAKKYAKKTGKPDVIIASSPHPVAMLAGLKIAKKFKVPCVCEVRDFWPEVFFYGGRLKEKGLVGRILLAGEKHIYKKADMLTFLKEGDHTYILDKKWDKGNGGKIDMDKCAYVNNGVDLERYDRHMNDYEYNDEDFLDDKFTVVYCGTIRNVNNVGMILDVAKLLDDKYKFLIFGAGECVDDLKKRAEEEHIENVKFKGYIDNKYVPSMLSRSSLNLLNYSGTAYNWSRGNSSNKLFEYLASGKPVLSTVKMGYDIIERYQCGASVENTTPEEIAEQIRKISEMDKNDYEQMCKNARAAAEDFDIPKLAEKYLSEINRVIGKKLESKEKENKND